MCSSLRKDDNRALPGLWRIFPLRSAEHDAFIASGSTYAITSYAFDAFGRETVRVDALGNAVTNAYDTLGQRVAVSGATYPLTHGYDTAGRATALSTTRDGGVWDSTAWLYNVASGLITNKVYADDTTVSFSYDEASRPLRTTWARGAWREQAYNADGLPTATTYCDATPAVSLAYDTFQRLSAASNSVAVYAYANDALGAVTNETAVIGTNTHKIIRGHDGFHRLSALSLSINNAHKGGIHYRYDAERRVAGLALTNAQGRGVQVACSNYAGYAYGYRITVPSACTFTRAIQRDIYRRNLITQCGQSFEGMALNGYAYTYDVLSRATARNNDAFGYNARSEVTSALIQTNHASRYEYDGIGNNLWASFNAVTNIYTASALNQYTAVNSVLLSYDPDGNLSTNGVWSYTWDAENRLVNIASNGLLLVTNAYDHQHRRVRKVTPAATFDFIYDGWNLIHEAVSSTNGTITEIQYFWGTDLSGTLQGAGGVGGLLAVSINGQFYFPCYDNNGNITAYADESGSLVAVYFYDAFGCIISQFGSMADVFRHRFSTKYFDAESGLYYYGYRFYLPVLMRWLSRDPMKEKGGLNLYGFVENHCKSTQIVAY
jgi:RHS repeat-associated protein